jgi:hypothetical protein
MMHVVEDRKYLIVLLLLGERFLTQQQPKNEDNVCHLHHHWMKNFPLHPSANKKQNNLEEEKFT